MKVILVKFWLLRFAQVFMLAGAVLSVAELVLRGGHDFSFRSVAGWSAMSALLTSSVAAYWAYKRQCKRVFKDPV